MDKSRSRYANPEERLKEGLIISRPELKDARHRIAEVGVTLFFWGVMLFLWQPLISLLAWLFAIHFLYEHMM